MSSKINIYEIVRQNFTTFKDEDGNPVYLDWVCIVLLPLIIALAVTLAGVNIGSSVYSNIVTAGSIFTGLLLNVLMLVYDQKTKLLALKITGDNPNYPKFATRKRVIDEVHYNISYCILVSILAVIAGTVGGVDKTWVFTVPGIALKIDMGLWFINFPLIFICCHLVLIVLMILKRVHKLIASL